MTRVLSFPRLGSGTQWTIGPLAGTLVKRLATPVEREEPLQLTADLTYVHYHHLTRCIKGHRDPVSTHRQEVDRRRCGDRVAHAQPLAQPTHRPKDEQVVIGERRPPVHMRLIHWITRQLQQCP